MKTLATLGLAIAVVTAATPAQPVPVADGVRLVLLIAVDQWRYDYLTRFRADYTGGLKQLLERGAVFTDAYLEHYPTVTAIGHATMLSGATPAVSGIVGNDWFDRGSGMTVTSVSDSTVKPVGALASADVAASPRRLLVSTVGDEIKMASGLAKGSLKAPRVIGCRSKTGPRFSRWDGVPMRRIGSTPNQAVS